MTSALWALPRDRGDPRREPKSGRIIKLPTTEKHVCVEVKVDDVAPIQHEKTTLSGWRKTAHEQKQKLFGPKPSLGTVLPKIERSVPIVPTKPVYHVTCANTGVKIVGGRLWGCGCGKPVAFPFIPGEYATDEQTEQRGIYI